MTPIIPISKIAIDIRVATLDDLAFIDVLQKKHCKQLGFFPRAQMEGYLKNQWMLIAEENAQPIGYIAWRDRYQKRDELGAIFQLCVSDSARRKLVGAMLVKAAFERSAYGCRLFCCWCAQDIEANRFWESLGFVALAFRAGSRAKDRVHIFWQKRIKAGDVQTPYWFPSQTGGGSIREDRLVLPIPPGMRWDDEMPRILPTEGGSGDDPAVRQLPVVARKRCTKNNVPRTTDQRRAAISSGGFRFDSVQAPAKTIVKAKPQKQKPQKHAPQLIAAARELRDRWMEQVNAGEYLLESAGKYDVCRLPQPGAHHLSEHSAPLLTAA